MMQLILIKLNVYFKPLHVVHMSEALVKLKESKPPLAPAPAGPSGNTTDSKVFIRWDGKKQSYSIAPEDF
jgi:hypothetical protein